MGRWLRIWVLAGLGACAGDLTPVPGTTTRVSQPETDLNRELEIKIFTSKSDCRGAYVNDEDLDLCLPHVDRASGEVRLGYQFRLEGEFYPLPAVKEHLQVSHQGTIIQDGVNGQAYTVIPHDPMPVSELYVLLIDGSSSMASHGRLDKVKQALLLEEVQDAFFPSGVRSQVLLMQFTGGDPFPVGGVLKPVDNKRDYRKLVKQLRVLQGYTHLYDAITYATGPLLLEEDIHRVIETDDMSITVVALTDGFNNVSHADTCADNAPRLSSLLENIDHVRTEVENLRRRPTVFTVGLGKAIRPHYRMPDEDTQTITPVGLCARRYKDRVIDGDLEREGIDNASLSLIADMGGGAAFVSRRKEGLGAAFKAAAAKRYRWFEVRYRTDPFYLRRSFTTELSLLSYATAESSIRIHPSAWLDAPPGRRMPDGWTETQPFAHTLTILMPALGLLITVSFWGAAWFNVKRAIFGGMKRRPKRRAVAPSPPPPPDAPPAA